MEMRPFGDTDLNVSLLGFGCGAVGGLMVRGSHADQERAIARALEAGVNYFDTAVQYGNGESERNLGRVLAKLKPENVIVGTKVRLPSSDFHSIAEAVSRSLEGSLQRLRMEQVDIFHLHNTIGVPGDGESLSTTQVLNDVVPAFERLLAQGKTRLIGITAIGSTQELHQVIDARVFQSAQVSYNLLNPSAGVTLPVGYPAQDYGHLLYHTSAAGMGTIGIRVLAGGALSGDAARHPIASPPPEPIGSGQNYDSDLERARRLMPLVREGYAANLAEAAIRYVVANEAISTILVGMASIEQFEHALAAVNKGPLSPLALEGVQTLQRAFVGEPR